MATSLITGVILFLLYSTGLVYFAFSGEGEIAHTKTSATGSTIANGTHATLINNEINFIYCRINDTSVLDIQDYRLVWTNCAGTAIKNWNEEEQVHTIGSTKNIPYSFLVFTNFQADSEGVYHCLLYESNRLVDNSTISVELSRERQV